MTALRAAIVYASIGWPVIALQPRGKAPITSHGVKDSTTDEATIRAWWTTSPDANVGLATGSGRFVVDIDDRNDGQASWVDLIGIHGRPPITVAAATGGGGWHIWFGGLEGYRLPGKLAQGIDIKSDGGYVVAPPSVHPSGIVYRWVRSPFDHEVAPAPLWLATLLTSHVERPIEAVDASNPAPVSILDRARRYLERCEPGISGSRGHTSTFRAASILVRGFRLNEAQALEVMREFNMRCCPPWDESELQRKLRQAATKGEMVEGCLL